ncbi:MAG: hypothetical protein IJ446_00320 [Oscillospiraceae bacterium]|nr:hypothetical protein [Oscillospiraceae bacterium]
MIFLTLMTVAFIVVFAGTAVIAALSGAGIVVMFSILAAVCVLLGVGLLVKLLAKGIFSLVRCLIFLVLLAVPVVNVIAFLIMLASLKEVTD